MAERSRVCSAGEHIAHGEVVDRIQGLVPIDRLGRVDLVNRQHRVVSVIGSIGSFASAFSVASSLSVFSVMSNMSRLSLMAHKGTKAVMTSPAGGAPRQ